MAPAKREEGIIGPRAQWADNHGWVKRIPAGSFMAPYFMGYVYADLCISWGYDMR
jgi:hypothetical protein